MPKKWHSLLRPRQNEQFQSVQTGTSHRQDYSLSLANNSVDALPQSAFRQKRLDVIKL